MLRSDPWFVFMRGIEFSWSRAFPKEQSIEEQNREAEIFGAKAVHRMEWGKAGCGLIPDGVVTSVGAAGGMIGAASGSGDILLNLNTLEVTAFGNGGMVSSVPFGSGVSGTLSTGFVFGLGRQNSSFGGGSATVNVTAGDFGLFGSASNGGFSGLQEAAQAVHALVRNRSMSPDDYIEAIDLLLPRSPYVIGLTAGQALVSIPAGATITFSNSTSPVGLGHLPPQVLLATNPSLFVLYALRQRCNE